MIHYLRQEEKSRSRKLWEEIFVEDSQSFVDFLLCGEGSPEQDSRGGGGQ